MATMLENRDLFVSLSKLWIRFEVAPLQQHSRLSCSSCTCTNSSRERTLAFHTLLSLSQDRLELPCQLCAAHGAVNVYLSRIQRVTDQSTARNSHSVNHRMNGWLTGRYLTAVISMHSVRVCHHLYNIQGSLSFARSGFYVNLRTTTEVQEQRIQDQSLRSPRSRAVVAIVLLGITTKWCAKLAYIAHTKRHWLIKAFGCCHFSGLTNIRKQGCLFTQFWAAIN